MAKAKSPFILGLASKSNREPPRHFIKTAAFKLINPSVKHSCSHRAEFGSPEYDGGVNSDIFFSSSSLIIILFSFFFFYLCVCNSLCFSFVQNNFFSQNQVSIHSVIQVNSSSLMNEKKNTLALLFSSTTTTTTTTTKVCCCLDNFLSRFFLFDFFLCLSLSSFFSLFPHDPPSWTLFIRLLKTPQRPHFYTKTQNHTLKNHHGESTRGVLLGARMAVREEEQRVRPRVREPNAHVRGERQRDREARI